GAAAGGAGLTEDATPPLVRRSVSMPSTHMPGAQVWRIACLRLAAPAIIGTATGACVAAATALVEGEALGRLAALPGLLPVACTPLALLATLGVAVWVTRA